MLIQVKTLTGTIYINPALLGAIQQFQTENLYSMWVGGIDYTIEPDEAMSLIEKLGGKPKVSTDDLVLATITTIERGETKNNQRPMWRCKTDTGEKVNIFLNLDEPAKDSYHLFEQAGWAHVLNDIPLYSQSFEHIVVAMRKDGQWWEIVKVKPYIAPLLSDYEAPKSADETGYFIDGEWKSTGGGEND